MSFDLSTFDALSTNSEQGVELDVRHPVTQEPIGWTLRIAGAESDRVKKVTRRQRNAALKGQRKHLTSDLLETQQREVLAACVISWTFADGVKIDGEQPDCTPENVDRLLKRFSWLGQQIDDKASDQSAFLPS